MMLRLREGPDPIPDPPEPEKKTTDHVLLDNPYGAGVSGSLTYFDPSAIQWVLSGVFPLNNLYPQALQGTFNGSGYIGTPPKKDN